MFENFVAGTVPVERQQEPGRGLENSRGPVPRYCQCHCIALLHGERIQQIF